MTLACVYDDDCRSMRPRILSQQSAEQQEMYRGVTIPPGTCEPGQLTETGLKYVVFESDNNHTVYEQLHRVNVGLYVSNTPSTVERTRVYSSRHIPL